MSATDILERPRADYRRITVEPVTPVIGAEIGNVDLSQPLDPRTFNERWATGRALSLQDAINSAMG